MPVRVRCTVVQSLIHSLTHPRNELPPHHTTPNSNHEVSCRRHRPMNRTPTDTPPYPRPSPPSQSHLSATSSHDPRTHGDPSTHRPSPNPPTNHPPKPTSPAPAHRPSPTQAYLDNRFGGELSVGGIVYRRHDGMEGERGSTLDQRSPKVRRSGQAV